jgi:hypothetical protein
MDGVDVIYLDFAKAKLRCYGICNMILGLSLFSLTATNFSVLDHLYHRYVVSGVAYLRAVCSGLCYLYSM